MDLYYCLFNVIGIGTLAVLWILFMPESLPSNAPSRRRVFRINILQTMSNIKMLFTYGSREKNSPVPYITGAFLIYCMCIMANILVSVLYAKHKFDWSPDTIGMRARLNIIRTDL